MKEQDIKNENIDKETQSSSEANIEESNVQGSEQSSEDIDNKAATAENETNSTEELNEETEELDPLTTAQKEIEELKDKYLRSVAEFDNYRRRTLKEKTELILNGGEKTITALLPVLDDMERAIKNSESTDDPQVLKEGMVLIYTKFVKTLEAQGVTKIETEDSDFNTDIHEAIAMVPGMGDDKKGKVIDCVQNGYKINDKVIRHAKVAVGQ